MKYNWTVENGGKGMCCLVASLNLENKGSSIFRMFDDTFGYSIMRKTGDYTWRTVHEEGMKGAGYDSVEDAMDDAEDQLDMITI